MSYTATPTGDGKYHIKVYNQDLYVQSLPVYNAGLELRALDASENKQKWIITAVSGKTGVYTIVSVADQKGVTHIRNANTYAGYGYPYPQDGPSENWLVDSRGTYSKIKLYGDSYGYVWDSNWGTPAVNFYYDDTSPTGKNQCYVFEKIPDDPPPPPSNGLDVLFVQDVTGSESIYIQDAEADIKHIASEIQSLGNIAADKLRFGLIIFRDHPPEDLTFVTKTACPFTTDINQFLGQLGDLQATGGGDGPEAQCDAFADALTAAWNDDSDKIVYFITDSSPHGIGESGDGLPDGCPAQHPNDPVTIANKMVRKGILVNVIACEPSLSGYYKYAHEFYKGIAEKTGGKMISLAGSSVDSKTLLKASILESHSLSQLAKSYTESLSTRDVQQLVKEIENSNAVVHELTTDPFYDETELSLANAKIWREADSITDARSKITGPSGNRIRSDWNNSGTLALHWKTHQAPTSEQAERVARMALARAS